MNDYIMIEIAFSRRKEVNNVINTLLDNKLIASAQVLMSDSSWNYKGKRTSRKEYLLLLKTRRIFTSDIYKVVKNVHSYETFEFAIFNLSSTSKEYLDWINDETESRTNIITL